jgi:DNA-directed RNA polymerase specialized sigma24 family protein
MVAGISNHMSMRLFNTKYQDDILGKAKTYKIPGMEWQDVAQELDISLWLKLDKFQGRNNASERTFAIKVMQNKILDLAKYASRKKRWIDTHHLSLDELMEQGFEVCG